MGHRQLALPLLAFCFVFLPLAGIGLAQDVSFPTRLTVLEVDDSQFPFIRLNVYVQGSNGQSVESLTNVSVSEANRDLSVEAFDDGPLNIAFLVDQTALTPEDHEVIQQTLRHFKENIYQEQDTVYIYNLRNGEVSMVRPTNAQEFDTAINELFFAGNNRVSFIEGVLGQAVTQLSQNSPGQNQQIVFISGVLADALTLPNSDIPIHVIQAHAGTRVGFDAFEQSATAQPAISVTPASLDQLSAFWAPIQRNRRYFSVSYRTLNGVSGQRDLTLSVDFDEVPQQTSYGYTQDIADPSVAIVGSDSNFDIIREGRLVEDPNTGDRTVVYEKNNEKITVEVTFPDNIVRNLARVELLVDGGIVDFADNPGTNIEFTWDISNYRQTITVPVKVSVEDEFGRTAESATRSFGINVITPTIIPTVEVTVVEEVVGQCINPETGERLDTPECEQGVDTEVAYGSIVALLVALGIALILILILFSQRRTVAKISQNAAAAAKTTLDMATGIFQTTQVEDGPQGFDSVGGQGMGGQAPPPPGSQTLAQLEIVRGPQAGQTIYVTKNQWSCGREIDAGVDFVIPKRNVSSIHFTITYERISGTFTILDHKSSNGTLVDGQPLTPYQEYPLNGETTIQLAKTDPIIMRFMPFPSGVFGDALTLANTQLEIDSLPSGSAGLPSLPTIDQEKRKISKRKSGGLSRTGIFSGASDPYGAPQEDPFPPSQNGGGQTLHNPLMDDGGFYSDEGDLSGGDRTQIYRDPDEDDDQP